MAGDPAEGAAGTTGYTLGVAGLGVRVVSNSPLLSLAAQGASRAFVSHAGTPDLCLVVSLRPLDPIPEGRLVFDSGGVWQLYEKRGRYCYRFLDRRAGTTPYKEAWLTPGGSAGEVFLDPEFLSPGQPVDPLEFPLDELLFLQVLAARGGVELHACGVVAPTGQGFLFAGQSGDGKTTTARLWESLPGASILSDDRIVVRQETDGSWWMYGTPWHGEAELALNARAPLDGMFILGRGERNAFSELSAAEAVTGLLARSFPIFHSAGPLEATLALLDSLVARVPCSRFAFSPGPDAVRAVLGRALSEKR